MGMTMKRDDKRKAQEMLKPEADGFTNVKFASPKNRRAALADRGHLRMTPAEVATHHFRHQAQCPVLAVDNWRNAQRGNRRRAAR